MILKVFDWWVRVLIKDNILKWKFYIGSEIMNIKLKKIGIVLLGYDGVYFYYIVMSFYIFLVVIYFIFSGLCLLMGG